MTTIIQVSNSPITLTITGTLAFPTLFSNSTAYSPASLRLAAFSLILANSGVWDISGPPSISFLTGLPSLVHVAFGAGVPVMSLPK